MTGSSCAIQQGSHGRLIGRGERRGIKEDREGRLVPEDKSSKREERKREEERRREEGRGGEGRREREERGREPLLISKRSEHAQWVLLVIADMSGPQGQASPHAGMWTGCFCRNKFLSMTLLSLMRWQARYKSKLAKVYSPCVYFLPDIPHSRHSKGAFVRERQCKGKKTSVLRRLPSGRYLDTALTNWIRL